MAFPRIRFVREKALTASPEVVEAAQDRQLQPYIRLGGTNRNSQVVAAFERGQSVAYGWLYINRPAVRTVLDYIARNVAQLPLKLYERISDDERVRREDHPAADVMKYPDGETPTDQFIFRFVIDFLIYNNAYLWKFRPDSLNGRLILVRVPPALVTVSGGRFRPELYRFWRYDGTHLEAKPEDVVHWRGYNPDDPLLGVSQLETLRDTLAEDAASQIATVELMKNGLKGGHIERPLEAPEWTDIARGRFQEDWANQRTKAPRLDPVLEEGMKWVPTAISPKDAELLAGRRFTVEEVARVYGLHPRVLGISESGSSTELEDLRRQVYTDVLPPLVKPLDSQLNYSILLEEFNEPDMYFEMDLNEKLRGDPDKRFQAITAAVGRPWLLVNEARTIENRPAVEGGDELTIPLNVALGSLPAPNVMPPQNPLKPPQDGSFREEPKVDVVEGKANEDIAAEVEQVLLKLYDRQERSYRSRKQLATARFSRELASDLAQIAPGVERRALHERVLGIHDALAAALEGGDTGDVFGRARASAGRLAKMLVVTLGLDTVALKELGVPDEVIWRKVGFSPEEVDQMRAIQLASGLTSASESD